MVNARCILVQDLRVGDVVHVPKGTRVVESIEEDSIGLWVVSFRDGGSSALEPRSTVAVVR